MMLHSFRVIRKICTTSVPHFPRGPKANSGIGRQLLSFKDLDEFSADPEGFGDMESDLMNVHKSHKQLEAEERQQKDKIRSHMIKHKYFRDPKMPNLLTYAEKEQIRLLHERDAEEWSAERLADSFPATPDIIRKILEAKWKPRNTKRIKDHDAAVIQNWEQFNKNDDDFMQKLSPSLKEHLKKFTRRTREDLVNISNAAVQDQWPTRPIVPEPNSKEFRMLLTDPGKIDSSQNPPNANLQHHLPKTSPGDMENETHLLSDIRDRRSMRLEEVKRLKLGLFSNAKTLEAPKEQQETSLQTPLENPSGTGTIATFSNASSPDLSKYFGGVVQYASREVVVSVEDQKRYEMTKIKDRIYIPKKLRRKGATYRVEDCYYDDDGEFLYRVPGMTE